MAMAAKNGGWQHQNDKHRKALKMCFLKLFLIFFQSKYEGRYEIFKNYLNTNIEKQCDEVSESVSEVVSDKASYIEASLLKMYVNHYDYVCKSVFCTYLYSFKGPFTILYCKVSDCKAYFNIYQIKPTEHVLKGIRLNI